MIIVKMIGGLGNQMFQIAYARMISMETGECIHIDTSVYDKYRIRSFSLNHLGVDDHFKYLDKKDLSLSENLNYKITTNLYRSYQKIVKVFFRTDVIGGKLFNMLVEFGYYYNFDRYYYFSKVKNSKNKYLYGYFQSEQYFIKYKNQIVSELKVKVLPTRQEKELIEEMLINNSVAVSMRLGDDYMKSSNLNVCSEDYYLNGIKYFIDKFEDIKIYIFSDEVGRAKKIINGKYSVKFVEGFKDYQSLRLLYSCKHFVISNSSFAWWGAYLSSHTDKIVVAPSRWYNDSKRFPAIYTNDMRLMDI